MTKSWPCVIAEADFSQNTVTLTMQGTDYKVSAGKHWLCTTPPQRTWVGLTDEDISILDARYHHDSWRLIKEAEAKLKQKNGYAEENT